MKMKKTIQILGSIFIALMILLSSCTKEEVNNINDETVYSTQKKSPASRVLKYLGFKIPKIEIKYQAGYYEPIIVDGKQVGYNCKPADATCVFSVTIKSTPLENGEVNGTFINIDEVEGIVAVAINVSSLTEDTYDNHFADGEFNIPEEWILPFEIQEALNLPEGYTISAGAYPLETEFDENGNEYLTTIFIN